MTVLGTALRFGFGTVSLFAGGWVLGCAGMWVHIPPVSYRQP